MRSVLLSLALLACATATPESTPPPAGPDLEGAAVEPERSEAPPVSGEELPWRELVLHADGAEPGPVTLDLDRSELQELFGPIADDIVVLELEVEPLLRNALEQIKGACGDRWQRDRSDPGLDCDSTELGRTLGPAERAMVRLLTMTPANVDVRGTSVEFLQELADFLGLGGGFSQILADNLERPRTGEILGTDALVEALRQHLLATHPGLEDDGRRVTVTLADALADLGTLGPRLGPVGAHPGVLAPDFVPHGEMLGPEFRAQVRAHSNVRIYDGINLGEGVDYVTTAGQASAPLEIDFRDPDSFTLVGLPQAPALDLRFALPEHPAFVPSCAGDDRCRANLPGRPDGDASVWTLAPWMVESVVARAGLLSYGGLRHRTCYLGCLAEVAIGQGGAPAGWAHFEVPFELGPRDQYVWELLTEVAQVRLHRDVPEGQGGVGFTLRDVPIGLDGARLAMAVRPYLQGQADTIANFILPDPESQTGSVDLYFRRTADGRPALFFLHPDDLPPSRPYVHRRPGFFAGPDLAEEGRLSNTVWPGVADKVHEKLLLGPGETRAFVADERGDVWEIRATLDPNDSGVLDLGMRPTTRG